MWQFSVAIGKNSTPKPPNKYGNGGGWEGGYEYAPV